MAKYFLLIFISILFIFVNIINAQQLRVNKQLPIIEVTGRETGNINNTNIVKTHPGHLNIPDLYAEDVVFSFHPTYLITGYDLQSNSTPQQIWQDSNNPAHVYGILMFSGQLANWGDRTCTYFISYDYGYTWTNEGNVPYTGERSGYGTITGMPDGKAVIADHDGGPTTHTKIYIETFPATGDFTCYDPGTVSDGDLVWPRVCVVGNDNILIASSINLGPNDVAYTINLNPVTGDFSNWTPYDGTQAESYSLAVSEDGSKTGHLYIANTLNNGDVFYRESSDGGYNWGIPIKIWDWNDIDSLGCLRGLDLIFLNNQPCAVFEVDKITETSYFQSFPSKIYFWSPVANGGIAFPIAESGVNVPFYNLYESTNDIFTPVCRPSIGRSSSGQSLFVAFSGVTENVFGDTMGVSNSYFAVYFTHSTNGGQNWTQPVKFTPDSPLRDWRYVSISPTNNVTGNDCLVQMFIQSDSLPGSNIQAPPGYPLGYAEVFGVSALVGNIPVELINFAATNKDNKIQLTWQTATEKNNYGFQILRSENTREWKEIGFVEGSGSSTKPHNYQFIDENVNSGTLYYRLKQIDFDGTYSLLKIASINIEVPCELKLFQNYPNPFNPVTEIKYSIPKAGNVSLKVYDILGNEVATLVNERKETGINIAKFNAANLSSGTYIFRIESNGKIKTKKLLLLK